jgi:sulfite exporter TauE/SafE
MDESTQLSLLLGGLAAGFFGSVHCFVMCGGIASALGQVLSPARRTPGVMMGLQLCYSAGRIASYSIAGALAGSLGFFLTEALGPKGPFVLRMLAGAFLVALGLYIAGWWLGLRKLEALGARLWKHFSPLVKCLQPVDGPLKAVLIGGLWGWLPCGLVYSVLVTASSAGSGMWGALTMTAFGVGTLPALLITGTLAQRVSALARRQKARWIAGGLLVLFGVWTFAGAAMAFRHACH